MPKANKGSWQPGQSGNPRGRPPGTGGIVIKYLGESPSRFAAARQRLTTPRLSRARLRRSSSFRSGAYAAASPPSPRELSAATVPKVGLRVCGTNAVTMRVPRPLLSCG
jgi:hypothetical protein